MAIIRRAHQWQASSGAGNRSMRCKRCGAMRLNAKGFCFVEDENGNEIPAAKAQASARGIARSMQATRRPAEER